VALSRARPLWHRRFQPHGKQWRLRRGAVVGLDEVLDGGKRKEVYVGRIELG
jgi:hypothetical protein